MIDAHFKKEQFQFYEGHGNASAVLLVGCEKGLICHLKENKLRQVNLLLSQFQAFFIPEASARFRVRMVKHLSSKICPVVRHVVWYRINARRRRLKDGGGGGGFTREWKTNKGRSCL